MYKYLLQDSLRSLKCYPRYDCCRSTATRYITLQFQLSCLSCHISFVNKCIKFRLCPRSLIPALPTELKDCFASLKHREKYTSLLLSDLKYSLYVKRDKITTEATNLLILLYATLLVILMN